MKNWLNNKQLLPYVVVMGAVIALSNVLVQYPLGDWLTYGALTYPLAFLVTDIVNRLFGEEAAKRVIVVGFIVGVVASFVGAYFAVTTLRIALASATAFLVAQYLDVRIFNELRHLSWWQTPAISSSAASVVDTFIFFSIAFSATTFMVMADGNDWALDIVPVLGFGRELPLWISLAVADLGIKLAMVLVLLLPYRYFTVKKAI